MERYKAILRDEKRIGAELDPSLFEAGRFFSFQPRDTNIDPASIARFAPLYEAMRQRFSQATHVGDKVPHLFVHYDAIAARLPGALFIYIVRDISDVACSWNKRAANPADAGWGAASDYRKAVEWWNRGNRETLGFAARGGGVRVVEYEKLWSGDERYLSALFAGLELEDEPGAWPHIARWSPPARAMRSCLGSSKRGRTTSSGPRRISLREIYLSPATAFASASVAASARCS